MLDHMHRVLASFAIITFFAARILSAPPREITVDSSELLSAPRPQYPYEARAKHLEGRGYFVMHVRRNGTVSRVDIIRSTGHRILDQAVVRAFSQWRFRPDSVDKVASPVAFSLIGRPY
jgi:TonB family protein